MIKNLSLFNKIYSWKCLPVIVDSFSFRLRTWEWTPIRLNDLVSRSFSPFSFLTRVDLPACAHPITIPLPIYTELIPLCILFTKMSLSFRFKLRISCDILTVKIKKNWLFLKSLCMKFRDVVYTELCPLCKTSHEYENSIHTKILTVSDHIYRHRLCAEDL